MQSSMARIFYKESHRQTEKSDFGLISALKTVGRWENCPKSLRKSLKTLGKPGEKIRRKKGFCRIDGSKIGL